MFLTLFVPLLSTAQTNRPIVSDDYLHLVKTGDSTRRVFTLPLSSANRNVMPIKGDINWLPTLHRLSVVNNRLLISSRKKELNISGRFRSQVSTSWANKLPALQHSYAQGMNNQYMGPETGTLFSYGPAMTSLEFDGSVYPYDKGGKLVPAGTGNGQPAKVYDNNILRRGWTFNNDLFLKMAYIPLRGRAWILEMNADQQHDKSIIRQNNNNRQQTAIKLNHIIKEVEITGNYDLTAEQYDYSNRNGFINRVYQYSLLTPVSFQNAQNTSHSYSPNADNPLTLLGEKGNGYKKRQHHANLKIETAGYHQKLRFGVVPSWQSLQTSHTEIYPNSIATRREQHDRTFLVKGNAAYTLPKVSNITSNVRMEYNYSGIHTDIAYQQTTAYRYNRQTHEPILQYNASMELRHIPGNVNMQVGNKVYISNTADSRSFWLPNMAVSLYLYPGIGNRRSDIYIRSGLSHFNSELPINQSRAALNLLHYTTGNLPAFQFNREIQSYQQLRPVNNREWANTLSVDILDFRFHAYHYIRQTFHDVLPIISGNEILLRNIADHKVQGLELSLSYNTTNWHSQAISSMRSRSPPTATVSPGSMKDITIHRWQV